jgi:regulator of sirC expression with transglutaminase-like and TPR domain
MALLGVQARAERVAQLAAADRLAEASLTFAGFVYPSLDLQFYIGLLDRMARAVVGSTHLALRRIIAIQEGIGGNIDDYGSPENSFLNRVLETRRGLPITVSVVWIEVGRRAGIEMEGVGLPGHFVVYAGGQLVDPFHYGEDIGFDEAASLVANALGGAPRLDPSWLQPMSTAGIIIRMLRNLEGLYTEGGDVGNLEWVAACLDVMGS